MERVAGFWILAPTGSCLSRQFLSMSPSVVSIMLLAAPFVPLTSHVAVRSTAHSWKCPRAPAALRGGTDRMLDHRQISWPSEEENEDRPAPTQGRYLRTHGGFLFKVVGSDDAGGTAAAGGAVPHEAESSAGVCLRE